MKIKLEDIPFKLQHKYDTWKTASTNWYDYGKANKEKLYADVDGTHTPYSKDQLESIELSTKITATINQLYPIATRKLALLLENNPSHKVISTNGVSEEEAAVIDKIKHTVLYSSKSTLQNEETVKEMLIWGLGNKFNEEDDTKTNIFGITSKFVPNEFIIHDPNVRDKTFSDQEGFFFDKEITIEQADKKYKVLFEELTKQRIKEGKLDKGEKLTAKDFSTNINGTLASELDQDIGTVQVREWWTTTATTMYLVDDSNDVIREFKENYEDNQVVLRNWDNYEKVEGEYWTKHLWLGNYQVAIEINPYERCPLTRYIYEWGGSPYQTYGLVHFNIPIQEAIDKMIQMFILNGMLNNNPGVNIPIGSVKPEDIEEFVKNYNNPLIANEYTPVEIGGKVFIPEKNKVEPLSNFYPTILAMLRESGEYTTAIASLSGNPSDVGVETFSTLQQYQDNAHKVVTLAMKRINAAEEDLGNSLIEFIIANIKPNRHYPYFTDDGEIDEFKVANDLVQKMKRSYYSLMTIPFKGSSSQRNAMAISYMNIAQTTNDPMEKSLYIQEAIKLSEIRGTKKLQEKLDIVKNSQQKVQQLEEELKDLERVFKNMEDKLITAETNKKIMEKTFALITGMAKKEGQLDEMLKQAMSNIKLGESNGKQ